MNNYIQKTKGGVFMKSHKILKLFISLIFIILISYAIFVTRNCVIISSLSNKALNYYEQILESDNFHKEIKTIDRKIVIHTELYRRNDKQAFIQLMEGQDFYYSRKDYSDNNSYLNSYFIIGDQKTAYFYKCKEDLLETCQENGNMFSDMENILEFSLLAQIYSYEENNHKFYRIKRDDIDSVFDSETGLCVKSYDKEDGEEYIIEYNYDFDAIDDSVFDEPDLAEYEVIRYE